MEEKKQSKIIFAVLGVAILLTLTVGLSFAIYTYNATGGENTIQTGTVSMSFTESTNVVNISNALPVQNEAAAKTSDDYFEFSVKSSTTGAMNVPYTINITEVAVDTGYTKLSPAYVQVYLTEVNGGTETEKVNKTANTILNTQTTGKLIDGTHNHTAGGELTTTYRLRLWIPYSVDASDWGADTKLEYKVRIDASGEM